MATIARDAPQRVWRSDPIGRVLTFATTSDARAVLLLVVLSLAVFLPGFFQIPPVDRDEPRFTQATRQMIETGDFIDIRFQDEVRYKKPVGIYWVQAAVIMAGEALGVPNARTRIWLYRIPSLIGAIGGVLLTYWTALTFLPRRYALLSAMMMAGSILLTVEAHLAKTDALLLLTTTAAMGALARAYLGHVVPARGLAGLAVPAIFWTALAAGVLIKGPVIVLVVGLTILTLLLYERSLRWLLPLRPAIGIVWCVLLVLPWFVAILSRSGEAFLAESVGRDLLPKLISPQEGHGAPPGFYLLAFWVTFWPAAPLAAMSAPAVWAERRERPVRFLLAWLVPTWIVLELVITKLPHYVLPLYPAIAILIARTLRNGALAETPWLKRATLWWPLVAIIVPVVAVVALGVMRHQLGLLAWPFGGTAMVLGFMAWRHFDSDGPETSLVRAIAASLLVMITFLGIIMPSLRPLFPSALIARTLQAADCDYHVVAAAGYHEPSLVFLVGTNTMLTDGAGAADSLRGGYCRFALVEAREQRAFAQRAEAIGVRYAPGPRIEGVNINSGRAVSMTIYRASQTP